MLYETLLQAQIFLCLFYFGAICGIVYTLFKLINKSFNNQKVLVFVTDLIFCIILTFAFIFACNMFNYGEFRFYLLLAFFLGLVIEQKTIGFLVEKFFKFVYNNLVKIFNKLKTTKIFKRILK